MRGHCSGGGGICRDAIVPTSVSCLDDLDFVGMHPLVRVMLAIVILGRFGCQTYAACCAPHGCMLSVACCRLHGCMLCAAWLHVVGYMASVAWLHVVGCMVACCARHGCMLSVIWLPGYNNLIILLPGSQEGRVKRHSPCGTEEWTLFTALQQSECTLKVNLPHASCNRRRTTCNDGRRQTTCKRRNMQHLIDDATAGCVARTIAHGSHLALLTLVLDDDLNHLLAIVELSVVLHGTQPAE